MCGRSDVGELGRAEQGGSDELLGGHAGAREQGREGGVGRGDDDLLLAINGRELHIRSGGEEGRKSGEIRGSESGGDFRAGGGDSASERASVVAVSERAWSSRASERGRRERARVGSVATAS